jgi:hypothetical protein
MRLCDERKLVEPLIVGMKLWLLQREGGIRKMGVNKRNSRKENFPSQGAMVSPGGDCPPIPLDPGFRAPDPESMCWECGVPYNSDAHRSFIFYHSPRDIEHAETMGGVPSEWRPSPFGEGNPIPGDQGPSRVAYQNAEGPVIQVHDGDDHGFWVPCSWHVEAREGMPYAIWTCRRFSVQDPCTEDFMKEISS